MLRIVPVPYSLISSYTLPMTIQQTVSIPADRRLHLDLPETVKPGTAQIVLTITRIADKKTGKAASSPKAAKPRLLTQAEFEAGLPCPMDHSPNAETIAAMQEVQDMIDGKAPRTVYHSLDDMLEALHR
jgi:hypothetical protein